MTEITQTRPTTQGESETETTTATRTNTEAPEPSSGQRAPAGAREASTETATETAPARVTDSAEVAVPETSTRTAINRTTTNRWSVLQTKAGAGSRCLLRWGKDTFTPPDVWSTRLASGQECWTYAEHSDYTPPGGILRSLKLAYTRIVAIPIRVAAQMVAWWFERPSRALLLFLTVLVVWLTSVGQFLASVLAWCLHTFADLIVL